MLQLQQVQKTLHFIFTKWCLLPLIFSISVVETESEFAESCPTLCEPMNCSLPGFSIHWIVQARVLEWGAFPSPEDLPNPGVELGSPALQADAPSELPDYSLILVAKDKILIHSRVLCFSHILNSIHQQTVGSPFQMK